MAVITTGNHPKALWPGVKAWWGRNYGEHMAEWKELVNMDTSDKEYEEFVQDTGFGLAPRKTQGGAVTYTSDVQGYTTRFVNLAYGYGYIVTYEELKDNKYEAVSKQRAPALAFSFNQTKENVVANLYNRAFNSSFVGGDGKEMIATDHPLTLGGTGSNELAVAADLSELALEDITIQIMDARDDAGLFIPIKPWKLIIPRQEFYNAHRILGSINQSGTANNDINVLKSQNVLPGGVCMNRYLTDSNAWFIKTNLKNGPLLLQREAISFTQDNDFDTMNAKAKSYERYSVGWVDWRGVYGTPGN